MAITCGAARGASRGSSSAGDQGQSSVPDYNGEVSLHSIDTSRTYVVYRPINEEYATKMAELMITACNNANIGYSQDRRGGVWTYGVNATTKTDADCSSLVSYCIYKATGKNLGMFCTTEEPNALMSSGLFTKVGTYTSGMEIFNGDVFCTPSKGHTYMAVKGNPRTGADTELSGSVTDTGDAYDSATGTYVAPTNIDTSVLDQYVLTIDRNTPNPDYSTMKKNRVGGVIIEAGYLYNSQHTVVSNPRNPYIQQQCKNAVSANMPYGLYWDVKARTVDEAKSELYQLQFLIRKYPPVMGIWLHLALTASKSTNNKIIDTYATELEILGLKDAKGFYVTAEELEKITWEDYQDDWWLWIVNPLDDISELDGLLQPYFFTISGEPGSAAENPDYNPGTVYVSSGGTSYSGTLTGNTNFQQIFNYMVTNGYTKQAAAAACGNLGGEGGLDANGDLVINSTEKGSGSGIGIVQWSYGRKTSFKNYASSVGEPWPNTSLKTQVDYMMMELEGNGVSQCWTWPVYSGKRAWPTQYKGYTEAQFKVCTDLTLATWLFCIYFESPYYYNSNISTRVSIAQSIYNSYA